MIEIEIRVRPEMRERCACRHFDREFQWKRFTAVARRYTAMHLAAALNREAVAAQAAPEHSAGLHVFEYRVGGHAKKRLTKTERQIGSRLLARFPPA